jgi:NAD(P) transhydrogenase
MNPSSCLVGCRIAVRPRAPLSLLSPATVFRPTPTVHQQFTTRRPQSQGSNVGLARPRPLCLQKHVPKVPTTAIARYASQASELHDEESPTSPPFTAGPYETLTIGIPKESYPGERRVAMTPANVKLLLKKGFSRILIERGAGLEAQFTDEAYEQAGAKTVDRRSVFSDSDILLKVRALSIDGPDSEVDAIREGATIVSFLYPNQSQNRPTVDRIAARKATAFAMDMVPRISRAQVFDALRYAHSTTRDCMRSKSANMLKVPWQTLLDTRLYWRHQTTSAASLLGR